MSESVVGREATSRFVSVLFGSTRERSLFEVRFRSERGMGQRFFSVERPRAVVEAVLSLAVRTDVFVGVLPRVRPRGRLQDVVERSDVIWADCDTPESAAALASFRPRPSIVVASGSGQHRHAYWLLRESVDLASLENLNRRLAAALGADAGVVTRPHTILRPSGSANWKHSPPAPVRLLGVREGHRVGVNELDRKLPPDRSGVDSAAPAGRARAPWRGARGDPLQSVPPPVYFERLTGQRVGRSGKVRCPFHDPDDTPSLHCYGDGSWFCFGACRTGGSSYDFAARLRLSGRPSGAQLRGRRFIQVRDRLAGIFLAGSTAAGSSGRVIDGSRARLEPLGEARPSAER